MEGGIDLPSRENVPYRPRYIDVMHTRQEDRGETGGRQRACFVLFMLGLAWVVIDAGPSYLLDDGKEQGRMGADEIPRAPERWNPSLEMEAAMSYTLRTDLGQSRQASVRHGIPCNTCCTRNRMAKTGEAKGYRGEK